MLKKEDFDDDTKDAGELGAGHSVTALYEIVPATEATVSAKGGSQYVTVSIAPEAFESSDLLTVHLRYKLPDADVSELITQRLEDRAKPFNEASRDFQFAAAVAEFGMLLRNSAAAGDASYEQVLETAQAATGEDPDGYRAGFLELVDAVRVIQLSSRDAPTR